MADFATYGWIKNSTNSTIVITGTHAVHGTWSQQPTPTKIKPGETSQFTQKDPTGAAYGSEGTISMLVVDESATTIGLKFQCGYAQDNYAKSSVDGSGIKVRIKAGSGDDGQSEMLAASWDEGVPGKGHPLYVTWEVLEA
ncbi:hypothetical protein PRUB_b1115 [Pseudoalteromonas rubra]|uniref:Uncharacterized protein n=1 Tax=Pseudoalteromonas rubra TaxID=43658 RepID=A0A8T0C1I0_9GAMM|nr:hypothetical protein [Pseudoalteromonas rubra]KAF7781785.1 hypothetical protein PRUB_b1115 [Pseudoalteromonas rubra]